MLGGLGMVLAFWGFFKWRKADVLWKKVIAWILFCWGSVSAVMFVIAMGAVQ